MLKYYISEYTSYTLIFILLIFSLIKIYKLSQVHQKQTPVMIFLSSFGLYSPQRIKNTFHAGLKKYYIASNQMNYVLYILLFFLLAANLFLSISGDAPMLH